jgi:hypothetical protein
LAACVRTILVRFPVRLFPLFWQLTFNPAGDTGPGGTRGVDKPMHIHRNECAETPTIASF